MRRRRGFTLIEALAAMGAGAIVLGLCVGTIHLLMRLDKTTRARLDEARTVGRLALAVRADVRAATAVGPIAPEAGGPLDLTLPDGRAVSYRPRGDSLLRTRTEGETRQVDSFRLPARSVTRWEVQAVAGRTVVALILGPARGAFGEARIEGVLGHDRRFQRREESPHAPPP